MFWSKKDELRNLSPSKTTFLVGVKHAQYKLIIWKFAPVIYTDKQMPDNYGWKRDCEKYISVTCMTCMITLPPAPEAPLQLIKCGCSKSVCEISRHKCKANHLYCTDL